MVIEEQRQTGHRRFQLTAFLLAAGLTGFAQQQVRVEPVQEKGQSVTPAYEGWFHNADGSFTMLIGYMNRNLKQELDIPIGPNNRIEPGGPDQGQPTHFLTRRGWGVFTIVVPKDFGTKKLTWTLTVNGITNSVPFHLEPLWELSPFKDASNNTPPFVGFKESGPFLNGPAASSGVSLKAQVASPLTLPVWVADDAHLVPGAPKPATPPVSLTWTKFRGPGGVEFNKDRPTVEPQKFEAPPSAVFMGKAISTVTFTEPGEYVLKLTANDWTGEGGRGFQCCWTNAQVKVSVEPQKGK
jgi:hypothetical protein